MTPEQIDRIRTMRGGNVPWAVIARELGKAVAECRAAIGMPVYSESESQPALWVVRQQMLFDQPERDEISER